MNANQTKCPLGMVFLNIALLCLMAVAPTFAIAQWSWDDPLMAVPKELETPPLLPGDQSAVSCPIEEDYTKPLVLEAAIDIALCSNPQLQQTWANIKVEANALGEASAAYLPTLSGSMSRIKDITSHPDSKLATTVVNSNTIYGTGSWRLFDFGTRAANQNAAANLLAAALANHDANLQKTLYAVIESYFEVYTTRAALSARLRSEDIANSTLMTTKKLEARGASSQSDTLQAMTALAKAQLEKNRAQSDYKKALSMLVYWLGIPATSKISLPDSLDDNAEHDERDLNDWLTDVQKSHPAILAARAELDAARHKVDATRAEGLPTLDLTGNYYENGRPGQSLTPSKTREATLGLVVSMPLFEGFARTYKIQGAKAQLEVKEASLAETEHQIMMEVAKLYADASTTLQSLKASEALLKAAQNSFAVSKRKFDKGAVGILELFSTQSALADAEQERIRCVSEWRSARLKLFASAGQMGRALASR